MKERPILFSGEMVRAILDGRKTQTRRVVKPQPLYRTARRFVMPDDSRKAWHDCDDVRALCPYGQPGDRLWVRETWAPAYSHGAWGTLFAADGAYEQGKRKHERGPYYNADDLPPVKWRPSLFMPRWASRITLEVVSVRVERLQDISEADARAEGVDNAPGRGHAVYPGTGAHRTPGGHRLAFHTLWDSINAKRAPWSSNPWVWVVEFKRSEVLP